MRVGADSMLVLTGVTRPADAVLAPPHQRPTYLAHDLAGLLEPHPPVTAAEDEFRCGGWTALPGPGRRSRCRRPGRASSRSLAPATPLDGLRALCAAAWSAGRVSADSVHSAVGQLHLPA